MIRSLRQLMGFRGYTLQARDGEIGQCHDFLFDDRDWAIRYLVADTRRWLPGRKVLIPTLSLGQPEAEGRRFPVRLDRAQIEQAPPLEDDAPVSREYEEQFLAHFDLDPYWKAIENYDELALGNHLRSAREVRGYRIEAVDDAVGVVGDYVVDDEMWEIRYVVVDIGRWVPGHRVLLAPTWFENIRWRDRRVFVDLDAQRIIRSPVYDPTEPVNRELEQRLYDYHGRPLE